MGDWVEIAAVGIGAEGLLNLVPAGRVQAVPGGIRFRVNPRYVALLEKTSVQKGIGLDLLERGGPGVRLRPYRDRLGLLAGLLVFLVLMKGMENRVWTVKYWNLNQTEKELISAVLLENRLNEGQTATQEKLRRAERQLMAGRDFGWVTLNFTKGRLVAERTAAEIAPSLPQSYPHDLVASTDAKITAMDVQSGFPCKQVGQTVTKGEVLIATSRLSRLEETVTQATQGRVMGEFQRVYQVRQPMEYSAEILSGPGASWVQLEIGALRLTCKGKKQQENGIVHTRGLEILGLALPATIITTSYPVYEEQTQCLSEEAALERARYRCLCALKEEYPDGEVLAETENYMYRDNTLEYCWTAKIRANIAVEGTGGSTIGATDGEK